MKLTYKISREALKEKDYKAREKKIVGTAPETRDREALSELLKVLKKSC